MIGAAHIVAGGIIGTATSNLWATAPLAFLSHYVLDAIPHREYMPRFDDPMAVTKREALPFIAKGFLDLFAGFAVIAFLTNFDPIALAGGFFGATPDGLTILVVLMTRRGTVLPKTFVTKMLNLQRRFHKRIHLKKGPYGIPYWRLTYSQTLPMALLLWLVSRNTLA